MDEKIGTDILNIYCPQCGAPANFDIVNQTYRCNFCGGEIKTEAAALEKKEQQTAVSRRVQATAETYELEKTTCSGCGASLVFEKNEALAKCAFCGRSLVREKYIASVDVPHSVIPFALTREDAVSKLEQWCEQNPKKAEAQQLKKHLSALWGYYLPYRLIRGSSTSKVSERRATEQFELQGYLTNAFVNCSKQLDNQLLDAMEPYDLSDLKEFDFAYVAGHRVKTPDLSEKQMINRLNEETTDNYQGKMEKVFKTKALKITTDVSPVANIPVLLPVYYISAGNVRAAVNGQTGKVSVRSAKESTCLNLPWWLMGGALLLLVTAITFLSLWLTASDIRNALTITGLLSPVYLIIFACMFEPSDKLSDIIVRYREIFTSGESTFRREKGKLVPRDEALKREMEEPVFVRELDGKPTKVIYRFRCFGDIVVPSLSAAVAVFLPLIITLLLNGFSFSDIHIGGSAVWLCIAVPVAPIYIIKFAIKTLYDNPRIYINTESGKKKRYKQGINISKVKQTLQTILTPPIFIALVVVLGFLAFTVYLTGFAG